MPMERTDASMELPDSGNVFLLLKQLIDACKPLQKQPLIFVLFSLAHPKAKTSDITMNKTLTTPHQPLAQNTSIRK